jgi:hypothetical protein
MKYDFQTYGPFSLGSTSPDAPLKESAMDQVWGQVESEKLGLQDAIGIYILALKSGKSNPIPWYVGKTDSGFRKRLTRRRRLFQALSKRSVHGEIMLFLLARRTAREKFVRPKDAGNGLTSIEKLETMLIGSCLNRNPELLNMKKMSHFKGLRVPGYMNDNGQSNTKPAIQLRKMLKEK